MLCTQGFRLLPTVCICGCVVWFLGRAHESELAADRAFSPLVLGTDVMLTVPTPQRTKLVELAGPRIKIITSDSALSRKQEERK